jgi:hypothetical protein
MAPTPENTVARAPCFGTGLLSDPLDLLLDLLEIESPGGFPEGITADNVRDRQNPRTRRIAEALARCSLVGPPPYQWRANCSSIWPARNVASNVTGLT